MSAYKTIATAFTRIGFNQNSLVSENEMNRALDTLAHQYGINSFDRNVAQQLWGETQKNGDDKVYVRDYINTIIKGQSLVRSSINDLERQIQYKTNAQERNQALQDLASYSEDLKYLTVPFGLNVPRQSKVLQQSRLSNPVQNKSMYSNHSTVIFAKQLPEKDSGSSTDLKIAFMLTAIMAFVQIIAMFHKHHFYSLLAYLSVFAIFFLGYFDQHYMKFVKINLLISVVLDLVWLFVNFGQYWTPAAQTQHSSLQWAFLKFILLFVLGLAFFKVVLAAILFKYRNNPSQMRRSVSILGQKYQLSAAPESPIARIVNGNTYSDNRVSNASGNYNYRESY